MLLLLCVYKAFLILCVVISVFYVFVFISNKSFYVELCLFLLHTGMFIAFGRFMHYIHILLRHTGCIRLIDCCNNGRNLVKMHFWAVCRVRLPIANSWHLQGYAGFPLCVANDEILVKQNYKHSVDKFTYNHIGNTVLFTKLVR